MYLSSTENGACISDEAVQWAIAPFSDGQSLQKVNGANGGKYLAEATGEYDGLLAICVGGKKEKRERAAGLAIAALAVRGWEDKRCFTPNPGEDRSFNQPAQRSLRRIDARESLN